MQQMRQGSPWSSPGTAILDIDSDYSWVIAHEIYAQSMQSQSYLTLAFLCSFWVQKQNSTCFWSDLSGGDEKILAVPHSKLHPYHDNVRDYSDVRGTLLRQIEHFFVHYKDLEEGKWAKVKGWGDAEAAAKAIEEAVARAP